MLEDFLASVAVTALIAGIFLLGVFVGEYRTVDAQEVETAIELCVNHEGLSKFNLEEVECNNGASFDVEED